MCVCVCGCRLEDRKKNERRLATLLTSVSRTTERVHAPCVCVCVCMAVWLSGCLPACLSTNQPATPFACLFLSLFQLQLASAFASTLLLLSFFFYSACLHTVALSSSVCVCAAPHPFIDPFINIHIHIHPSSTCLQRPPLLQVHISCTRFARSCMVPLDLAALLLACALTST